MLERQFADFLTSQIKSKIEVLEQETEHDAVKDLKAYIEQLDGIFAAVLSQREDEQPQQPRTRRKRAQTEDE